MSHVCTATQFRRENRQTSVKELDRVKIPRCCELRDLLRHIARSESLCVRLCCRIAIDQHEARASCRIIAELHPAPRVHSTFRVPRTRQLRGNQARLGAASGTDSRTVHWALNETSEREQLEAQREIRTNAHKGLEYGLDVKRIQALDGNGSLGRVRYHANVVFKSSLGENAFVDGKFVPIERKCREAVRDHDHGEADRNEKGKPMHTQTAPISQ